ncbi:MAG: molybdopterin-binding protein [Synergistaceae bacterium]|nr:molybdopterin-binding protein [Synergistota bacterium]NLM71562.1 molybdopterin-binding protein [Synergistaceae bacterium]
MEREIVPVEQAVGRVIEHDLTLIDPDTGFKGAKFRRGHTIRPEDIAVLRRMGKSNISFLKLSPDEVHEDDAALRLGRRLAGYGVDLVGPEEGKCSLKANRDGLLLYEDSDVDFVNDDPDWILTTLPNKVPVKKGHTVASFRIGPLVAREDQVARAEAVKPISVREWLPLRSALVITGRELFDGTVKDAFKPRLEKKLAFYGGEFLGGVTVPDDRDMIAGAISAWLHEGADLVLCTGGMSVDADDLTPSAISEVCDRVVFRRVPVIPGTNIMMAVSGGSCVLGVPAAAAFIERTSLDILLDRIFGGVPPDGKEVREWGKGGLCVNCNSCGYPMCAFAAR